MHRISRLTLAAALLLGALGPAAARAQGTGGEVALIGFTTAQLTPPVAANDSIARRLSVLLASQFGDNAAFHLVDAAKVQRVVDVQHLVPGRPVDRQTAVRIGQLVGARHVVYGAVMVDAAGNVRVDVHAANVASGAVEYTDRLQESAGNPAGLATRIATRLASAMGAGAP